MSTRVFKIGHYSLYGTVQCTQAANLAGRRGRSGLTGHVLSDAVTGGNERSDHHLTPASRQKRCHGCWSKGFYVGSSRDPRELSCAAAREDPTLKLERIRAGGKPPNPFPAFSTGTLSALYYPSVPV